MQIKNQNETCNEPIRDHFVIKKMRILRNMSRNEAALLFNYSRSSIEKIENGRAIISKNKIHKFVEGYGFTMKHFMDMKLGRNCNNLGPKNVTKAVSIIEQISLRRSYKKLITDEVIALTTLRKKKGFSKYEASRKCGWWKGAISHIEHGRIELHESKIKHIVTSYGYTMKDFYKQLSGGVEREKSEQKCIKYLYKFDDVQLRAAQAFMETLLA